MIVLCNCQAQGPTQGPTQGQGQTQGQDMVWSWSGQVRSGQTLTPTPTQMWDLSYTLKLVFTTTTRSRQKFWAPMLVIPHKVHNISRILAKTVFLCDLILGWEMEF